MHGYESSATGEDNCCMSTITKIAAYEQQILTLPTKFSLLVDKAPSVARGLLESTAPYCFIPRLPWKQNNKINNPNLKALITII